MGKIVTKRVRFMWPVIYAVEGLMGVAGANLYILTDRLLQLQMLLFSRFRLYMNEGLDFDMINDREKDNIVTTHYRYKE